MLDFRAYRLGLCLLIGLCAVSARATVLEIVGLEELVARSDMVVQGEVLSTEGAMVGGHIETTVKLRVDETWKGTPPKSGELVLTQMGGVIQEPLPIGMAVPGLPSFAAREEVVLFLATPKLKASPQQVERAKARHGGSLPALWTSPQVVGGFQGKFNIYADSASNSRMVVRQSALAPQGGDPDSMPLELQIKMAESLAMLDSAEIARKAAAQAPTETMSAESVATGVIAPDGSEITLQPEVYAPPVPLETGETDAPRAMAAAAQAPRKTATAPMPSSATVFAEFRAQVINVAMEQAAQYGRTAVGVDTHRPGVLSPPGPRALFEAKPGFFAPTDPGN